MRAIKVTWRAVFQQPTGALNPMGLKMPGPFPVEIFGSGEKWQARHLRGVCHTGFKKLAHFTSPTQGKATVEQAFERQIVPWQLWGTVPGDGTSQLAVERPLEPDEVADLGNGKMALKGPEDYTHIIHAQTVPLGARIPPAACGVQVNAKCFISTKANVEPTCKGCAEVWRREYQNR